MLCSSSILFTGPEHQEFQVSALANVVEFQQPAKIASYRNSSTEQSDGTVVSHAFPHASSVSIPSRFQGVVLEPSDRHD